MEGLGDDDGNDDNCFDGDGDNGDDGNVDYHVMATLIMAMMVIIMQFWVACE